MSMNVHPISQGGEPPAPDMVWMPGGTFHMGSEDLYPEERLVHAVTVTGFWMDRYAVTNERFVRFVEATSYVTLAERPLNLQEFPGAPAENLVPGSLVFHKTTGPVDLRNYANWWVWTPGASWQHPGGPHSSLQGLEKHPVVYMAYEDTQAYAHWAGKELPTEAEWEFAARAVQPAARFTWGNEHFPAGRPMANAWQGEFPWQNLLPDGDEGTSPVGSFPPSGYGLCDMAGNVWEWTSDWYVPRHADDLVKACCGPPQNPCILSPDKSYDPVQPQFRILRKVVKGGSHLSPIEGVAMNYSFDDAEAPTTHPVQYFEMLGNRGIISDGWKAVTFNGRLPWENRSKYASIDEQQWELYHIDEDPAEANDLMKGRVLSNLDDPMVKKLIELVGMWWAEAGRYNVLPLDDRFNERALGRGDLYSTRSQLTFYPGAVRIPESNAPNIINRSWSVTAHVEIPKGGAEGPIIAAGGETNGISLYLKEGKPVFCYNLAGSQLTYCRSSHTLAQGRHTIRFDFEKTGQEPFGAGGVGRLYVDDTQVAEGQIPRTVAFGLSADETFDVGCDKGAPVTEEYKPLAEFTGKIIKLDFDLKPDFHHDPEQHARVQAHLAMIKQ